MHSILDVRCENLLYILIIEYQLNFCHLPSLDVGYHIYHARSSKLNFPVRTSKHLQLLFQVLQARSWKDLAKLRPPSWDQIITKILTRSLKDLVKILARSQKYLSKIIERSCQDLSKILQLLAGSCPRSYMILPKVLPRFYQRSCHDFTKILSRSYQGFQPGTLWLP